MTYVTELASKLDIEEPFKLYYVDSDGDAMLVSAHTELRDVIYSEAITARIDADEDELAALEEAPRKEDRRLVAGGAKVCGIPLHADACRYVRMHAATCRHMR